MALTVEQAHAQIEERVRNGQLTPDQGVALAREVALAAQGMLPQDVRDAAPPPGGQQQQDGPPRGEVRSSDYALAVKALMNDGSTELEARRTIMSLGGNLSSLSSIIDRERAVEQR